MQRQKFSLNLLKINVKQQDVSWNQSGKCLKPGEFLLFQWYIAVVLYLTEIPVYSTRKISQYIIFYLQILSISVCRRVSKMWLSRYRAIYRSKWRSSLRILAYTKKFFMLNMPWQKIFSWINWKSTHNDRTFVELIKCFLKEGDFKLFQ